MDVAVPSAAQRERGLELVRRITAACLLGGAALLVAFAAVAAATIPGHSDSTSGGSQPAQDSGQLQGPADGYLGPAAGTNPYVVTGGSR